MSAGALYLIPVPLHETASITQLSPAAIDHLRALQCFVVEDAKTARRWIKQFGHPTPIQELVVLELYKHQPRAQLAQALERLREGQSIGLMSEAGCPGIADPGAAFVSAAHEAGIRVVPLMGPSAILLGLMASGMNGQRFAFVGYLPTDTHGRGKRLQELEKRARSEGETQIFIETPYRNNAVFAAILAHCAPTTRLCVACDLTAPSEFIASKSVRDWRTVTLDLKNRPTVFLLSA